MSTRVLWAALLGPLLGSACGWHAGVTPPAGVRTVGVQIFGNETLEPDLEPRLSASLSDALERFVATDIRRPSHADAVVRGTLTDFRRRMGVRDLDNQLFETGVSIALEAELVHRDSGQVLRRTERHIWSDFVLGGSAADQRAAQRALDQLAERVILDLFRPVAYEAEVPEPDFGPNHPALPPEAGPGTGSAPPSPPAQSP